MSAVLSDCGKYRYLLERDISMLNRGTVLFVMLNPSTADAENDDPTIRKCKGFADRLGCSVAQLSAVAAVESGGGAFFTSGHPKILWERHYFFKRLQIRIPFISDPSPGGYTMVANRNGVNDSWEKLADAAMRAPGWAFESCSWGKFQIMGAWWEKLGYPSAAEFAWSMRESEAGHYEAFVRYVETFGLVPAIRAVDGNPMNARPFAKGYNGTHNGFNDCLHD